MEESKKFKSSEIMSESCTSLISERSFLNIKEGEDKFEGYSNSSI